MVVGALAVIASPPVASGSTIIFQRALPNINLNDAAGANRSNISWLSGQLSSGTYFTTGDDFTFTGAGAMVSSITIYEVANNPVGSGSASLPGNEFSSMTLYVGPQMGTLNTADITYNAAQIASNSTQVFYNGGVNYQSNTGFFPLYAVTFNLSTPMFFSAGTYGFAVDATATNAGYGLFLAGSNAALSGAIEQGADNNYIFDGAPAKGQIPSFAGFCDSGNVSCGGWDKSSDLNVLVNGSLLPEPCSFGFVTLGLVGALVSRRRLRR
jgi:hypothetical protein